MEYRPSVHPNILWAQRQDTLFVTVEVSGVQDEELQVEPTMFRMSGKSGAAQTPFSVQLELYAAVDAVNYKRVASGPSITFYFRKESAGPYWPRLTKSNAKLHFVKTDFSRWKDEDEVDEEQEQDPGQMGGMGGMGNFDFSQFANMGAGGEDEEEDEDEAQEKEQEAVEEESKKDDTQ